MHYYPHHIGDFISDTSRLSDSQCMAYLRLIWIYYDTEKPLENDPESLAFKIGASSSDVILILKHYFFLDGDVWRNTRCDKVLDEYHGKADKARKSAEIRWKNAKAKQSQSNRNANASVDDANESKIDANQEPITNNQEPKELLASHPAPPKLRATRLPNDWQLTQDYANAVMQINPALMPRIHEIAAGFRDYWIAKSGKDATKNDWLATWRNWIRRESENAKNRPTSPGGIAKQNYGQQRGELFDALTDYQRATNF